MGKQLIRLIGGTAVRYSIFQFKKDRPGASYPTNPASTALQEFGCYWVDTVDQPDYDRSQYNITDEYYQENGGWKQRWVTVEKSAEEKADYAQSRSREIEEALQQRLDEFAQTRGYDGIMSACTYASSTNTTFAQEGKRCVEERDATWSAAYSILADYEAGNRSLPTVQQVLDEIPPPSW